MNTNNRQIAMLGYAIHAVGLCSLIVGGCIYHFGVSAVLSHQQRKNTEETAEYEELLQTASDVRREHREFTQELIDLEERAEAIRRKIPDRPEESDFLEQVAQAAQDRGMVIQQYLRGGVTTLPTHSLLEIRLTGEGDYQSICGFLEEVANLSRVATVQRMNLSIPANSELYPLDITITLYFGARAPEGKKNG